MKTIKDLQDKAAEIAGRFEVNSISPVDVGSLIGDTVDYMAGMERNLANVGIRKVYPTISEMEQDVTPLDFKGNPIRFGQLVGVYSEINGEGKTQVFSYKNPGWELVGVLAGPIGYTFAGVATPDTIPDVYKGHVFYLASTAGVYPNFGGIHVEDGMLTALKWSNNTWVADVVDSSGATITRKFNSFIQETAEDGFSIADSNGNIVAKISEDGKLDCFGVGDNLLQFLADALRRSLEIAKIEKSIQNVADSVDEMENANRTLASRTDSLESTSSGLAKKTEVLEETTEDGFFITDSNGNIVAKISEDGKLDCFGVGDNLLQFLSDALVGSIDFSGVEESIADITKKTEVLEETTEDGFFITDSNGNIVAKISEDGKLDYIGAVKNSTTSEMIRRINSVSADIQVLQKKTDAIDSLLSLKKSGEYSSSAITIPASDVVRKNVVLRVGLHYGSKIGKSDKVQVSQSDIFNDVYFDCKCEKNFSDVRFTIDGSIVKHRLEHQGNYEVVRDNNFYPGSNFAVDYEEGTIYQRGRYSLDGGVTWVNIPNLSYEIQFIDSRKNLFSIVGSKVYMTPRINGAYDGSNSVQICDVSKTSTGNYSTAYPTQGSRAFIEDNDGYVYFGTNGPEWNVVIFRSINPDMSPENGVYVKEVYTQEKVYKPDGSLDRDHVDQHVHNFYFHEATNTVYAGLDNSDKAYGPRIIKSNNNGVTWKDVEIDSDVWRQQRGRDYIPSYISENNNFMLGGGEVNILGGYTLCKVDIEVNGREISESRIRGVVNNGIGVRNITSFGDDFIIAGYCGASGGSCDIQLALSEDHGESWKTIYSENVPSSIGAAGAGVRWMSNPFTPNGLEERILITGTGASESMPYSPLVVYRGGEHYYGEAYVYVGDIPAGEEKTITVESGYLAQMPYLVEESRDVIEPVYSIAFTEGACDIVKDSMGTTHEIYGEYTWDKYHNDVRFGTHTPPIVSGKDIHGLRLYDNTCIPLGKIAALKFNKGFSIAFWYKWDGEGLPSFFDSNFVSKYYDKVSPIIAASDGSFSIGLYRAGYMAGKIGNAARGSGCRVAHRGMYEFICLSVTDDALPSIIISRGDDYSKQNSVVAPTSWNYPLLSEMDLQIGAFTGTVNNPMFIHSVMIFDKVLTMEEVQKLYKGGHRI